MAGIQRTYIHGRADFFAVLDETLALTRDLLSRGVWAPLASIEKQLEAMKRWTAAGREPTLEERKKVQIGLVAARELEPAETDAMYAYNQRIYELNGYFKDWLSDAELATFDDSDPLSDFID